MSITNDPCAYLGGDGKTRIYSTQGEIDFNVTAWNSASDIWRAQTLIHELGHIFDIVKGAGGSDFVYDALPNGDPDPVTEAKNQKILQDCIKD